MKIDEFRIMHSILIEHYQFVEFHLEGISAVICGKEFISGLKDVEKSNISRLVQEINQREKENKIHVLTDADYEKLDYIRLRRNYWCHNCYVDMVFDRKTGGPKKEKDIKEFIEDLKEAEQFRERLYQIKISLMDRITG